MTSTVTIIKNSNKCLQTFHLALLNASIIVCSNLCLLSRPPLHIPSLTVRSPWSLQAFHPFTLPPKDSKNFIPHLLYRTLLPKFPSFSLPSCLPCWCLTVHSRILYIFFLSSFCIHVVCLLFDLVDELRSDDHTYFQLNKYNIY